MNKLISGIAFITVSFTQQSAIADSKTENGLIHLKSPYSVTQTLDRLENILLKKGMTIFKRVTHSASAKAVGHQLRDTELLIFGNPKIGSLLMQCEQTTAIDLPQKALAYKDNNGIVWLSYNNPEYLRKRHNIRGCDASIEKVSNALTKIMQASIQP